MSDLTAGFLSILVLLALLILVNVPVAFSIGIAGVALYIYLAGLTATLSVLSIVPYTTVASWSLATLPLFIIMGDFAIYAGISSASFNLAQKWLSRWPGGLAITSIAAAAMFACVCGSSVATGAAIGKIAIPEMRKRGYSGQLATGCISCAGTLGILIPPSSGMIIYGLVSDASIGRLFIAGYLPGILSAAVYVVIVWLWTLFNPKVAPVDTTRYSWGEKFAAFKPTWGLPIVVLVLMGGLAAGVFTATECGAIGAFVTFLMFLVTKGRSLENLRESLLGTGKTTCMVLLIILAAMVFAKAIAYAGVPQAIVTTIQTLEMSRYVFIAIVVLMYIILGTFMEGVAMVVITVPIILPAVLALGFDPIWFGIIVIKMIEIGQVTPPVGIVCFVIAGVAGDVPLGDVFKGMLRFFLGDLLVTVPLLVFFPQISLFLPSLMMK